MEEAVTQEGEGLLLQTDASGACPEVVHHGEPWKDRGWDLGDIELGDLGNAPVLSLKCGLWEPRCLGTCTMAAS